MQKSIMVIPQVNNPPDRDTECLNGPAGSPQSETWLTREMPQWIGDHFRVRTDRESWATGGYSFGGHLTPSYEGSYRPYDTQQLDQYSLVRMARSLSGFRG